MNKPPLYAYVIAVSVVLALVNVAAWSIDSTATFHTSLTFSGGFLLGMLAMYIAAHLYRWK